MSHTLATAADPQWRRNHVEYPEDHIRERASCLYRAPNNYCEMFRSSCPFLGDVDDCNSPDQTSVKILRLPVMEATPKDRVALRDYRALKAKWATLELLKREPDAVAFALAEYSEHMADLSEDALRALTNAALAECSKRADHPPRFLFAAEDAS